MQSALFDYGDRRPQASAPPMHLRPYQRAALHGDDQWPGIYKVLKGERSALLVLPTGCGKTIVFAKAVEACVTRGRRALIMAHRRELLDQAAEKLIRATEVAGMDIGVERAESFAGEHHAVVVGSVQTLSRGRCERFNPAEFGLVVVDEAHHAAAQTYRDVIAHFGDGGAFVLGVTATPYRLDGERLEEQFRSMAFQYAIGEAISDGWLVRVRSREIHDRGLDLREVGTKGRRGDFRDGELAAVMEGSDAVALAAKVSLEEMGERPAIVFGVSIAQCEAIADAINAVKPGSAAAAHGRLSSEDRRRCLSDLSTGRLQYLVTVQLLTEGYDEPRVAGLVMARPTRSLGLYTQCLGRGLRLLGNSYAESVAAGKTDCLVADLVGLTRDDSLVSATQVLYDDVGAKVRKRVQRRASEEAVDLVAEMDRAIGEVHQEELRLQVERVRYTVSESDPLAILGHVPAFGQGDEPARKSQLERLARHGVKEAERQLEAITAGADLPNLWISADDAAVLLGRIDHRRRKGLCTPRQARVLARSKLPTDVTFEAARAAIDKIAAARWRPSPELREAIARELAAVSPVAEEAGRTITQHQQED